LIIIIKNIIYKQEDNTMKKNLKKFLLIIPVNIAAAVLLLIAADYLYSRYNYYKTMDQNIKSFSSGLSREEKKKYYNFNYTLDLMHFSRIYNQEAPFDSARRVSRPSKPSQKKSLIFFGCSYAYGQNLEDNETIEYLLSQKTDRTVYNRGFMGMGLSQMLYITRNKDFYNYIDKEPEYAFYIFITDHINRILSYKYTAHVYLNYEIKDGHLVETPAAFPLLRRITFFSNFIYDRRVNKIVNDETKRDELFDLMKLYFEESRAALKEKYPDIKFVIIKYPLGIDGVSFNEYIYNTERWRELEEEGFIVYDLKEKAGADITKKEYILPDAHPNAKAWEIISRRLINDLNL